MAFNPKAAYVDGALFRKENGSRHWCFVFVWVKIFVPGLYREGSGGGFMGFFTTKGVKPVISPAANTFAEPDLNGRNLLLRSFLGGDGRN